MPSATTTQERDMFAARLDDADSRARQRRPAAQAPPPAAATQSDPFAERLAHAAAKRNGQSPPAQPAPPSAVTTAPAEASAVEESPAADAPQSGPLGRGQYIVRRGDCVSSISRKNGFYWKTLWNDAQNHELKAARETPNALLPGDGVHIPEKRLKDEAGATAQRHRFIRRGEPSRLRLQFKAHGRPRAHEPFQLTIDNGSFVSGQLDGDGRIDVPIPGTARKAKLKIGAKRPTEYDLSLGAVDPLVSVSGVQQRLENLGVPPGNTDGELTDATRGAVRQFQADNGLPATGAIDEVTRRKLLDVHGV